LPALVLDDAADVSVVHPSLLRNIMPVERSVKRNGVGGHQFVVDETGYLDPLCVSRLVDFHLESRCSTSMGISRDHNKEISLAEHKSIWNMPDRLYIMEIPMQELNDPSDIVVIWKRLVQIF
jgi:hypothetical protein